MTMSLDQIAKWVRHYAVLQGVGDYRFDVSLVPGLTHEGVDAWAVVTPNPGTRAAVVQVRDIDATPISGFDGDPLVEIRVTISHEMFHVLLAEWLANPTVENEERVVESAAQAVVRSELGGDARIVARSIRAIPTAIRARVAVAAKSVSALASRRRGKGRARMDIKLILAAIKAAMTAEDPKPGLEALISEIESMGAGESGGDEPPAARDDAPPGGAPVEPPAARAYGRDEPAPTARKGMIDAEVARARKAADGTAALFARGRVRELRADGIELDAAFERELVAERDPDVLERRIADFTRGRSVASSGQQRARSGVEHETATAPAGSGAAPMTAAQLAAEGFDQKWIEDYGKEHKRDPMAASAMLSGGRDARARKASGAGKRGN